MLQHFSSMLLRMYEAAEHAACADFPAVCFDEIDKVVHCDVGVLGCGFVRERRVAARPAPPIDPAILSSSFHLRGPPSVLGSLAQLQNCFDPARLLGWAHHARVRQLLLVGSPAQLQRPVHWLLLGRRGPRPFAAAAAAYLSALWPHLLHCNELHLRRYLACTAATAGKGGFAVISPHLAIVACDAEFLRLAGREWPGCHGGQLPAAALARLHGPGLYEGHVTRWSFQRGPADAFLCHGSEGLSVDMLTPAETVAARHYALGLTHGEIASLLGVTSNTVRTHLAHVYSKLDIHRKSELPARLRQGSAD